MKNVVTISAMAAATVFTVNVACADTGEAWIWGANPDVLTVQSNGQEYTNLTQNETIQIQGKLNFDTGTAGTVKSWWAKPHMVAGFGISMQADIPNQVQQSKSYPLLERPKSVHPNLFFLVPVASVKPLAESACYFKASTLKNEGLSNQVIFSKDRYVHIDVSVKYGVDSTGAGSGNQIWEYNAPYELKVKCAKWKGPAAPTPKSNIASAPKVEKAIMLLDTVEGGPRNQCKIKTNTTIKTDRPNVKVKYRFVHSNGSKSNVFTTTTTANGLQVVKHDWDIPIINGPENGWVRIEGVSPNFKSNKAAYNMNCSKTGGFKSLKQNTGTRR